MCKQEAYSHRCVIITWRTICYYYALFLIGGVCQAMLAFSGSLRGAAGVVGAPTSLEDAT